MNPYEQMEELQRGWKPPRELAGSSPRETRLTGAGVGIFIGAVILFLGAIAAGAAIESVARRQAAEQKLLREQGVETQGKVLRIWRGNDKERQPMLSYQFRVGEVTYSKRVQMPLGAWKKLSYNSPVAILYVPAKPNLSRPVEGERTPLPHWLALLAGAALAGGGVALLVALHRARQLLSEGRAAPAVVTKYSQLQHNQKLMHYQFPLLGGGIGKGKGNATRKPLPIGGKLNVIYHRENPRRNVPYPMELVRLDTTRGVS